MKFNARKFTEIRLRKKVAQKEIAQKIGCAQSTVLAWESGKSIPNKSYISMVASALGCRLEELLDDSSPVLQKSKRAMLAEDPLFPELLDSWLMLDIAKQAQLVEYAGELAKKHSAKNKSTTQG